MIYSFQLTRHPNIHYRAAIQRLSCCELLSMLKSLSIETEIHVETLGGASFLTFESRVLTQDELSWLAGHSSVVFQAAREGNLLLPLPCERMEYMPEDLPEILKYKGKTNPTFTRMMINTALSLTPFARSVPSPVVLDPLCGRGTTLFCALCAGAHGVGIDIDQRDLKEASDFFVRYLKYHRMKHELVSGSDTVLHRSIPRKTFTFAPTKDLFKSQDTRTLTLWQADTSLTGPLMKKKAAHIIVSDLPYGVQHAPQDSHRPEPFHQMLKRVLPSWKDSLCPKGAIALSFNTLTIKAKDVRSLFVEAGFLPVDSPDFRGLAHSVEQAVTRDVVFALVP